MRIAFDGEFERLPPSGIGGYVQNLVANLSGRATDLDLAVVLPTWDHRTPSSGGVLSDRRIERASWEVAGFGNRAAKLQPDLLHIPSFAAPVRTTVPYVVTVHDMIPFLLPEYRASRPMRLHMALMKRTVRRAELIIAPSNSAAGEIASVLGYPADRIRVTPEAADAGYCPIADRSRTSEILARFGIRGRYIFNVGGLDVRKNVALLIEAFSALRSRDIGPIQLVIAGSRHSDNPVVFPPLEPIVERLGLGSSVVFTGRISEKEKLALYQVADLYVTPSIHEGFGLTALEAMACGIPTIAANRTSFPEVVGDGGLLVEPDIASLVDAMEAVISTPGLASELREKGIVRAASFSWGNTAERTLDVYREVHARQNRT